MYIYPREKEEFKLKELIIKSLFEAKRFPTIKEALNELNKCNTEKGSVLDTRGWNDTTTILNTVSNG